jgi:hypothetical protein
MTNEKWQSILGNILDKFDILDRGNEHIDEEGGVDVEYLEFISPIGKIRLEYITRPMVTGKKTLYSNRVGSETKVEYQYNQEEKTNKLNVYRWEDGSWQEIDASKIIL